MKENIKSIIKTIFIVSTIVGLVYLIENYKDFIKEPEINYNSDLLEIYYLDVGQADSILIRYQNNNILIDTGNNKDGPKLVEYFKSLNISNFKYIFLTHNHEDHIGGMDDIIRNFNIEHVYMTKTDTTYTTYKEVIKELNNHNIIKEIPYIDQEFNIDEVILKILWIGEDQEDLNENSMVLKLNYKDTSYIFMSDLPQEIESILLDKDIKSDVLKVGHHGSKYSTNQEFLDKVDPKYAIITLEENNDYNYPHKSTLNKLNNKGITIYRTDLNGTIKLISDGESINIETIKTDTNQKEG